LSNAAYHVGLSGVTRYALSECVKGVFQNKLGHRYFPDPQEMRRLCDQAMQPHEQQREREHRQRRLEQEAAQHRPKATVTPEARARSLKRYQEYCATYEAAKKKGDDAAERARIRAEYGLTDDALSRVPNAPNSFRQIGSN
jgi:hypothetical protein